MIDLQLSELGHPDYRSLVHHFMKNAVLLYENTVYCSYS